MTLGNSALIKMHFMRLNLPAVFESASTVANDLDIKTPCLRSGKRGHLHLGGINASTNGCQVLLDRKKSSLGGIFASD